MLLETKHFQCSSCSMRFELWDDQSHSLFCQVERHTWLKVALLHEQVCAIDKWAKHTAWLRSLEASWDGVEC